MPNNLLKKFRVFNTNSDGAVIFEKFITPEMYGAIGDGITDDSSAIQAAINASITQTGNVNILFSKKTYKVNTEITVDSSTTDVTLYGNDAIIINGTSTINKAAIRIYSAKKVFITNLHFDDNNNSAQTHHQIYLGDYSGNKYIGVARIVNCDFYNFGKEATRGITIENCPYFSGATGNYDLPSCLIEGCNFYNQNTTALASINYNTASYYGFGIYIGERSEYIKISNCNFNYIRIALNCYAAANIDVSNCNFLACFPKDSGLYGRGVIYVTNTGGNNGKINIVGCKFNHNLGYSIYWLYGTTKRPLTVTGCHFIANCATPIYISGGDYPMINGNWFERASQAFTMGLTNQPFGASLLPYINLVNTSRGMIRNNRFVDDGTYGVVSSGTSDYNIVKGNSWVGITGMSNLVGANNQVADNDNI